MVNDYQDKGNPVAKAVATGEQVPNKRILTFHPFPERGKNLCFCYRKGNGCSGNG